MTKTVLNERQQDSKEMFANYPDLLTTKQAKTLLHIANNKMYDLLKNGEIESMRIGKSHRITKSSIIDYVKRSMRKGAN